MKLTKSSGDLIMSIQQAQQAEMTIEEARKELEKLAAFRRLEQNPDWKIIIEQGFFIDEPIRLVMVKCLPKFASDKFQASILAQIDAIGNFRQYLTLKVMQGEQLEKDIKDCEDREAREAQDLLDDGTEE